MHALFRRVSMFSNYTLLTAVFYSGCRTVMVWYNNFALQNALHKQIVERGDTTGTLCEFNSDFHQTVCKFSLFILHNYTFLKTASVGFLFQCTL